MKLDIEAMAREADMEEAVPGLFYASDRGLLRFARLIVERCAVEAENTARIIDSPEESAGAIWAAEDIRSLLED